MLYRLCRASAVVCAQHTCWLARLVPTKLTSTLSEIRNPVYASHRFVGGYGWRVVVAVVNSHFVYTCRMGSAAQSHSRGLCCVSNALQLVA
jgi:hypothetical protein